MSVEARYNVRLRVVSYVTVGVKAPWPTAAMGTAETELRKQIRGGRRMPRDSYVEAVDVSPALSAAVLESSDDAR